MAKSKKTKQDPRDENHKIAINLVPYSLKVKPLEGEVWFSRHLGSNEDYWEALGGSKDYFPAMVAMSLKNSKEIIPEDNLPPGSPLKGFLATEISEKDALMWVRIECGTRQDPDKANPTARINIVPMAVGVATDLLIEEVYPWDNHFDGEVKASFDDDCVALTFQDPYFMEEHDQLKVGEHRRFFLYGVAIRANIEHTQNVVCKPDDPRYQRELAKFLANHPDKTAAAMPDVVIRRDMTSMLGPDIYWTHYEFVGPVLSVTPIGIFGGKVYQVIVTVQNLKSGKFLALPIYIKDGVLEGGRVPVTGDHLHGELLLMGSMYCHVGMGAFRPDSPEEAERLANTPLVVVDHTLQ